MVFFGCLTGVIFLLSPAFSLLAFEGEEDDDEFEEDACFLFRVVVTTTTSEGLLSAVNVDNDDNAQEAMGGDGVVVWGTRKERRASVWSTPQRATMNSLVCDGSREDAE